jgi:hypothetical protein
MNLDLLWAVLAGAVLGSLADWLFAGILFHERYKLYPEIWRAGVGESGEKTRILLAQGLALVTAVAFTALAVRLGQVDLRGALKLAAMIWLIAPLPLLLANALFIKIDVWVTASHAVGWLVKLLLCGGAVAFFL